jgi:hypothetical protein
MEAMAPSPTAIPTSAETNDFTIDQDAVWSVASLPSQYRSKTTRPSFSTTRPVVSISSRKRLVWSVSPWNENSSGRSKAGPLSNGDGVRARRITRTGKMAPRLRKFSTCGAPLKS